MSSVFQAAIQFPTLSFAIRSVCFKFPVLILNSELMSCYYIRFKIYLPVTVSRDIESFISHFETLFERQKYENQNDKSRKLPKAKNGIS